MGIDNKNLKRHTSLRLELPNSNGPPTRVLPDTVETPEEQRNVPNEKTKDRRVVRLRHKVVLTSVRGPAVLPPCPVTSSGPLLSRSHLTVYPGHHNTSLYFRSVPVLERPVIPIGRIQSTRWLSHVLPPLSDSSSPTSTVDSQETTLPCLPFLNTLPLLSPPGTLLSSSLRGSLTLSDRYGHIIALVGGSTPDSGTV